MKPLIVCLSYHHNNTQRIAEVIAKVLDAKIATPQQTNPEELQQHNLVGFGSGIDSGKHYEVMLDFVDMLARGDRQESIHLFNQCDYRRRKSLQRPQGA